MADFSAGANRMGQGLRDVFGGTLLAGGVAGMSMAIKDFTVDSVKLFGTLDKLTRFTATLDKSFQTPEALRKFREDIQQLQTIVMELPQYAGGQQQTRGQQTVAGGFGAGTQNPGQPKGGPGQSSYGQGR